MIYLYLLWQISIFQFGEINDFDWAIFYTKKTMACVHQNHITWGAPSQLSTGSSKMRHTQGLQRHCGHVAQLQPNFTGDQSMGSHSHGISGPNRNRWFTEVKTGRIFHGKLLVITRGYMVIIYPRCETWCWNMHTYIYPKNHPNVGKYCSTMELLGMGSYGI